MDTKILVGERIRIARVKAKLKQEDVARYLGISKSNISEWENGKRSPGMDQLPDLAIILGTTEAYILGFDTHHSPEQDFRILTYGVQDRSDDALQLAMDFDHLDDYGQRVLRTTADLLLEQHRKQ